jgi:predicted membrane-bound spermidine synthase
MPASTLAATAPTLLCILFVLSGAAGLIYESIWSRYLGLFLGHSAYAQVLVLAIFLGGMSAGAALTARRAERVRHPLLWYAAIELAAGVIGLLFHALYTATTALALGTVFPALADAPTALLIAKWAIGAALILPQSLLLGATFPLMTAGVVRQLPEQPGRTIAALYFANSIGAAGGVLLSGFWLIRLVGLPGTVLTAALLNIVVALATYLVSRSLPAPAAIAPAAATVPQPPPIGRRGISILLLGVTFGTAVASFVYEIAWIRMLALVLGSATHAFDLMLSAFILGLALGALCVRPLADREAMPLRMLAQVQWAMGAFALVTVPVYVASFDWIAALLQAFARTPAGYSGFNLARYALCLAVMLPATFCAGMTLPLLTKSLISNGWGERAVGTIYSVNTLGSIVGVGLAGLVLLPVLGVQTLLVLGAALDMALGTLVFVYASPTRRAGARRALAYGAMTAAACVVVGATPIDEMLLSSGVFRSGRLPPPGSREILFYRDGRTASVAVYRATDTRDLSLVTNGKPDASLSHDWFGAPPPAPAALKGDNATQVLASITTLAHRPAARTAALVGFGSGMSSHALLGSPSLTRLTTIEIEPAMIEGARAFYPANRRAYDDPRSHLVIDDAKSFFAASQERFDLILSEPSNPWVSGVSSLFGGEFYEVIEQSLAEHGVFAQWIQLYEINDVLILSVLAAVHEHFGAYEVFVVGGRDALIVASKDSVMPPVDWSVLGLPEVARDFARFVPITPDIMESARFLDRAALAPVFALGFQPNSDFFPILDVGAEEARYLNGRANGFIGLSLERFTLVEALMEPRPLPTETVAPVTFEPLFEGRAQAGRLRAALASGDFGPLIADPDDSGPAYALWQWANLVNSDRPPADWQRWIEDTVAMDAHLHLGSSGAIDEHFYGLVHGYLERQSAPPEAVAAMRFVEALGRWDFATAAELADGLLPAPGDDRHWLPPRVLLDGAVVAKLRGGDVAGAKRFRAALTRDSGRRPDDVRRLLIDAYIAQPQALRDHAIAFRSP